MKAGDVSRELRESCGAAADSVSLAIAMSVVATELLADRHRPGRRPPRAPASVWDRRWRSRWHSATLLGGGWAVPDSVFRSLRASGLQLIVYSSPMTAKRQESEKLDLISETQNLLRHPMFEHPDDVAGMVSW